MKTQYEIIHTEYINDLALRGKSTKNPKYSLKLFTEYLKSNNVNPLCLTVRSANEFQCYLVTKTQGIEITFTSASVLNIVGAVQSFYDYLKQRGIVASNPFRVIQKVKRSQSLPRNILKEDEMDLFSKHLRGFTNGKDLNERRRLYKAHVVAELMYSTGARINEVMSLRTNDLELNRGLVTLKDSKTGKERKAILNEYAIHVLQIYLAHMKERVLFLKNGGDANLLFGTATNLKMYLNELLNAESQKLKLGRFTTHNFRHALGYHLLRAGCDIRCIKDILGHEDIGTTQIYTKVDKEDLRGVIDEFHPRRLKHEKL